MTKQINNTSDQTLFTAICVIFIAVFVNFWAILCAIACFFVVKHLQKQDNQKPVGEADSQPAEKSAPNEGDSVGSDDPLEEGFISQKDINSILNSGQNEGKENPFDPKNSIYK